MGFLSGPGSSVRRCMLWMLPVLLLCGCGAGDRAPPNFVILIADDLGWDDVGAYGNDALYTPNIDRLAKEGVQFTRFFLTTSSCSASRASILTGKYPHSNGLVHLHQSLAQEQRTLAKSLRDVGYYTGAAGKWHIGSNPKRDFDLVREDREGSATRYWPELLRDRPRDRPFFLWLASRDPHRPHDGGKEFARHYDASTLRLPQGFVEGPRVREELLNYYLEVSRFDFDVGRVVAQLREQGVLDNTFIVVMSDNGRPFHGGKTRLYDDGIKTPFIVYWPRGMGDPGVYEHLLSAIDIAPTILDLAGAPIPDSMQGRSFKQVFTDRTISLRDYAYSERNWHAKNAHERAVRSARYLYKENQYPLHGDCVDTVWGGKPHFKTLLRAHEKGQLDAVGEACFAPVRDQVELLAVSDRGVEFANLAGDPEYAAVLQEMAQQLRSWRESTGDFDYQYYERPPRPEK